VLAAKELGPETTAVLEQQPFFVNFLRAAPEPTGEEEEEELEAPKVYEMAPSFDVVQASSTCVILQYHLIYPRDSILFAAPTENATYMKLA